MRLTTYTAARLSTYTEARLTTYTHRTDHIFSYKEEDTFLTFLFDFILFHFYTEELSVVVVFFSLVYLSTKKLFGEINDHYSTYNQSPTFEPKGCGLLLPLRLGGFH